MDRSLNHCHGSALKEAVGNFDIAGLEKLNRCSGAISEGEISDGAVVDIIKVDQARAVHAVGVIFILAATLNGALVLANKPGITYVCQVENIVIVVGCAMSQNQALNNNLYTGWHHEVCANINIVKHTCFRENQCITSFEGIYGIVNGGGIVNCITSVGTEIRYIQRYCRNWRNKGAEYAKRTQSNPFSVYMY